MRRFKGECAHFNFNKCPIYTHDVAFAKISTNWGTNSHETDNSVLVGIKNLQFFSGSVQIIQIF